MRKGFSLVELSVVLVIIGLLISGILVGKSMVQTARVEGLVKDLHQYEIAVNNFTQARKFYPGDDPNLDPSGDGNGYVDETTYGSDPGLGSVPPDGGGGGGMHTMQTQHISPIAPHGPVQFTTCNGNYSSDESTQAFAQMSALNMLPTAYQPFTPTSCAGSEDNFYFNNAGTNAPYTTVDNNAMSVMGTTSPKIPLRGMKDIVRSNYYIYFVTSSRDVKPLETKMGANIHYDNAVGLVNFDGVGQCDDGSSFYQCTDTADASKGNLGYFISGGDM